MEQIQLGAKGRYEMAVNRMVSAAAVKDGLLEVFGTPFLVMMMENASIEALSPFLEEGEGSVGTRIDVTDNAFGYESQGSGGDRRHQWKDDHAKGRCLGREGPYRQCDP